MIEVVPEGELAQQMLHALRRLRLLQLSGDQSHRLGALGSGGLRLRIIRRHLTTPQLIMDGIPSFEVVPERDFSTHLVEADPAFGFLGAMALDAIGLEECW